LAGADFAATALTGVGAGTVLDFGVGFGAATGFLAAAAGFLAATADFLGAGTGFLAGNFVFAATGFLVVDGFLTGVFAESAFAAAGFFVASGLIFFDLLPCTGFATGFFAVDFLAGFFLAAIGRIPHSSGTAPGDSGKIFVLLV
jgi:hypothetical protein